MDCRISLLLAFCLSWSLFGCTSTDAPVQRGAAPTPPPVPAQTTAPPPSKLSEADKTKARINILMGQAGWQVQVAKAEKNERDQANLFDKVREIYRKVLDMDPKHLPAYQGLTQMYLKMGDKDRALATINEALKLAPRDPNLLYDQAIVFACRREWKEAENALFNALQIAPENRQFKKQLGLTLAREGQLDRSIEILSQVYGGPAYAHYLVARMCLSTFGQEEAGKQHLRQALQADPNLQEARTMLNELENPGAAANAQASPADAPPEEPRIFIAD